MKITLFLLPALLQLSQAAVLPLEGHALAPTPTHRLKARNTPGANFHPEDESGDDCDEVKQGGPGTPDTPDDQVKVNAAASGPESNAGHPAGNDEGEDDCEEVEEEEEGAAGLPSAPNDRTVVNAAADGPDQNQGNAGPSDEDEYDCEGDDDDDEAAESPPDDQIAVNNAADGPGPNSGGAPPSLPGGTAPETGGQGNAPQGNGAGSQSGHGGETPEIQSSSQSQSLSQIPSQTDATSSQTSSTTSQTSSTTAQQPGASGGGGSDGDVKVGLAWDPSKNSADLSSYIANGLQWWYEWGLAPKETSDEIEFVPQVWGPDSVKDLPEAMKKWPAKTKHVFSLNEPDIKDGQAGQYLEEGNEAADAARLHKQISDILGDQYWLGTPAVATGVGWLKEWDAECQKIGGCRHDFIAAHFYGTKAEDLINMIKGIHDEFGQDGKKVWLTEWACHQFPEEHKEARSCSPEEADTFMQDSIKWFRGEGKDIVDRWAWFGAFDDMKNWSGKYNMDANRIANADGIINDKGKKYLSL